MVSSLYFPDRCRYSEKYQPGAFGVLGCIPDRLKNQPAKKHKEPTMRSRIITAIAALALGAAFASVPAFAQQAPLSPGGVTAAADSFGGPGYSGPAAPAQKGKSKPVTYSTTGPTGAPLSPGGVTAAADSFGGPGYSGPQGHPQADGKPASYSSTGPGGAPLSPGGVTTAADSFGGPGYNR
jgi:hypothetical protein